MRRTAPARITLAAASIALLAAAAVAQPGQGRQPRQDRPDRERPNQERPQRQRERQQQPAQPPPEPQVTITIEGEHVVFRSNGLPGHTPGQFPTRGNPNPISAQEHTFKVPLHPRIAEQTTPMRGHFGIALNGVPFDPGTAEFWSAEERRSHDRSSGWNYEALSGKINLGVDAHHAHVQPTGKYHYHGLPTGLIERVRNGEVDTPAHHHHHDADAPHDHNTPHNHDHDAHHEHEHADHEHAHADRMIMIGFAGDGFPMYAVHAHQDPDDPDSPLVAVTSSYQLKQGARPEDGPPGNYDGTFVQDYEYVEGSGDLDECNGRTGVTPEYPDGTYYYVVTDSFPFVPRLFRGTPDETFIRRGGGGRNGDQRMRGPGRGRPEGGRPGGGRRGPGGGRPPR